MIVRTLKLIRQTLFGVKFTSPASVWASLFHRFLFLSPQKIHYAIASDLHLVFHLVFRSPPETSLNYSYVNIAAIVHSQNHRITNLSLDRFLCKYFQIGTSILHFLSWHLFGLPKSDSHAAGIWNPDVLELMAVLQVAVNDMYQFHSLRIMEIFVSRRFLKAWQAWSVLHGLDWIWQCFSCSWAHTHLLVLDVWNLLLFNLLRNRTCVAVRLVGYSRAWRSITSHDSSNHSICSTQLD